MPEMTQSGPRPPPPPTTEPETETGPGTEPPTSTPPPSGDGNEDMGNGYGDNGETEGNGKMKTETWDLCQGGLTDIKVDDAGCPIDRRYCKTQAGDSAAGVLTTAAWTLTITVPNFTEAMITGFVLQAFDNAAGNADLLHTQTVTSIVIQGDEQLGNGLVGAERYRADATGAKEGTGQKWRGRLGTTGGNMVVQGVNNSLVTVDVIGTVDINAVRA